MTHSSRPPMAAARPGGAILILLLVLLSLQAPAGARTTNPPGAPETSAYRLDAGDVLRIRVFGEPDLSPEIRIGEKGTIPYPFLGDLAVRGLTTDGVEALIVDGLKGPYLIDPRVSVTVAEYRPFYLDGQVRKPGSYSWEPGMTVRKAITLAGGLTERASSRKIFLLPETAAGDDQRLRVDLDHAVGPGDIITVEESFF